MSSDSEGSIKFQPNFTELFTDAFMRANTKFQTMDEMLESASIEDVKDLQSERFSQFVADNTRFSSWEQMYTVASETWMASHLGELQ
jgi:hypothetical protein